jgi:hypothetical protein
MAERRAFPLCYLVRWRLDPSVPRRLNVGRSWSEPCSFLPGVETPGAAGPIPSPLRESTGGALHPRRMQVGQHNKLPTTILLNLQLSATHGRLSPCAELLAVQASPNTAADSDPIHIE